MLPRTDGQTDGQRPGQRDRQPARDRCGYGEARALVLATTLELLKMIGLLHELVELAVAEKSDNFAS